MPVSSGLRPEPTREEGLSREQAAGLLAEYGPNALAPPPAISLWSRVFAQLRDPLVVVLLAAVALTLATADYADAVIIGVVVLFNTTVGVVQEVRADNAVAALSAMTAPTARVLRDGTEQEVASADVVPGDALVLGEGDIVSADGILLQAAALLVDESTLTGESVPADKEAHGPDPEAARLRAGTVVVRGRALATVTTTGSHSALGVIAASLHPRQQMTPLQKRLAGLGKVLALVTVGLCLLVLALGLLRGQSLELMALTAISLVVAAVPESLPAVVTLGLALGARRMATRNAVVRRLSAVETLGSVTVLATDKTGTLTEGRMLLERVWTPHGTVAVSGSGYEPVGEFLDTGLPAGPGLTDAVREVLVAAALCNDASLVPPADADAPWAALGDPTEAALLTGAAKAGCAREGLVLTRPRVGEIPFDSLRKRMTTLHSTPRGTIEIYLKGAPETVLDASLLAEEPDLLEQARTEAAALSAQGYRVLAVAAGSRTGLPEPAGASENGLRLLGLAAISDPPKEAAEATVRACRRAGIASVLITGDHPATARAIAVRVGILRDDEAERPGSVVTGQELAAGQVPDVTRVRVFARTTPQQKLDIVQAWQARGEVTAMTGDGVNDGPALRQADIGVAMGRRGTEVARQAADLVLADDELTSVVAAVEEGRRVYANIRRFLLYALAGGAAEIMIMLLGPLFGLALPLRAGQILWINLLTHGLTGVAMGAEPASPDAMHHPPRRPNQHVLGDGLWQRVLRLSILVTAVCLGVALWARHTGGPWQTVLFLSLLAAQLGVAMGLRERVLTRRNLSLPVAVLTAAALGAAAAYVPFLAHLLDTTAPSWPDVGIAAAAGIVAFLAARTESRPAKSTGASSKPTATPRPDHTPVR
ncbi:cation-translocating P-type ATPase [Streptomyces sp. B1I3]|uniref:cation-translocating P-type ATPase n=1 Tax=Streptomyces sp. B1I3 TaxID=3042264 RepID=UPI00278366EF|nr:cation-translocating P-type ATPase [Streptomyces sp. B1I3]MDQ0793336.1 Ca2+-transporting ATPase [Streptomyces sp. B1I3]